MKVMLVNGSSHLHGTTMTALEEMIKVFHSEEVETEVVQLGGKPIADCLQCNVCQKTEVFGRAFYKKLVVSRGNAFGRSSQRAKYLKTKYIKSIEAQCTFEAVARQCAA